MPTQIDRIKRIQIPNPNYGESGEPEFLTYEIMPTSLQVQVGNSTYRVSFKVESGSPNNVPQLEYEEIV